MTSIVSRLTKNAFSMRIFTVCLTLITINHTVLPDSTTTLSITKYCTRCIISTVLSPSTDTGNITLYLAPQISDTRCVQIFSHNIKFSLS